MENFTALSANGAQKLLKNIRFAVGLILAGLTNPLAFKSGGEGTLSRLQYTSQIPTISVDFPLTTFDKYLQTLV